MKKIVLLSFVFLLLSTAVVIRFVRPVVAEETIYIRPDGTVEGTDKIQRDGNVYTFTENIINQSIVVERNNTVVDGAGYTLDGPALGGYPEGIDLTGRKNVTIKNMNIEACGFGIYLSSSSNNNITGNNITNNSNGIYLHSSSDNYISRNNITNNGSGVLLQSSSNNNMTGNNITENKEGIWLDWYANYNNVYGNNITNNGYGIDLSSSSGNTIGGNTIAANTESGIALAFSSDNNSISGNDITNNNNRGIYIGFSSGNSITGNTIKANNGIGVNLYTSSGNEFYHNNLIDNTQQTSIYNSTGTWDDGYPSGGNYWSDYTGVDVNRGPNQDQPGSDGIGDTAYVIDADNKDHYPLMHPWSPLSVHNINTGLGYATIQEAINAPETLNGHTVFVEAGTYYENLVVNKTVSLFGENIDTTIIDGNETGDCVNVTASSTKISGFTIQNGGSKPFTAYASVRLFTSGNTILNNNLISSWCGVWMEHYSDYNLIANNTIMGNLNGIAGQIWHNTKIIGNTIKDNLMGIWIGPYSQNNIISFNNINGHWSEGIMMMQSSNNTFEGNNIVDNNQGGSWAAITIGFQKGFSSGNKFFHNNIANMGKQIELQGASEPVIWDDGYPSGGNYWSDYTGVDYHSGTYQNETGSDGVGDTPYTVDVNNQDNYPLMGMFSVFNATSDNSVQTICNSSISDFQFNGTAISFNVSGEESTTGFCRISIPTALMNGTFKAFANDTEVPYTLLPCSNSTYSYLYFTYNHSTQEVIIIPEFPTWTTILLILIVLTVAVVIYKRRLLKTPIH